MGNEAVDSLAKEALRLETRTDLEPTHEDLRNIISRNFKAYLERKWQIDKRSCYLGGHKSELRDSIIVKHPNRGSQVALTRLRLGHSRLKSYLFRFNLVPFSRL